MTTAIRSGLAALVVFLASFSAAVAASPEIYVKKNWDYALGGFDATSYFDGEPVKGDPAYSVNVANATYIFASAEARDKFQANPAKYRPAYGGYCAYGLGEGGYLVHGDPKAWTIHNGVLYVNYNKGVRKKWLKKTDEYIRAADALWPAVLSK